MDWNDDGKQDLISGDTKGQVWLFLNEGTKNAPKLAEGKRVEAAGKPIQAATYTYKTILGMRVKKNIAGNHELAKTYSWLHMGDWNGDGLGDLLVGHSSTITYYKNVGSKSEPRFLDPILLQLPKGKTISRPSPYVVDWDGDGTNDLVMGGEKSPIYFFRNSGSNKAPELEGGVALDLKGDGFANGYRYRFDVVDWNEDGKRDLLVRNAYGKTTDGKRSTHGNIWLFLAE